MSVTMSAALALLLLSASQTEHIIVHIPTSDALRVAQIIARNEGYDIKDTKLYYFDSLDSQGRRRLLCRVFTPPAKSKPG